MKLLKEAGIVVANQAPARNNMNYIWLLEVEKDGTVTANYPWRFASLSEMSEIKKILRKVKVRKTLQKVELLDENSPNSPNQQTQILDTIQDRTIEPTKTVKVIDVSSESKHSPFNALLVALFSLGFYWLLYRSKFKIR